MTKVRRATQRGQGLRHGQGQLYSPDELIGLLHSVSAIRSRVDPTGCHLHQHAGRAVSLYGNGRSKGHRKRSAGGGGARTTAHRKTNQVSVQHFRALRKQVWRPQRNQSRWGDQACHLRVAVTRDARARGRAGCGAGHRQSSAHRRWQNCGGRPLENPFERFALIPIFAPNTLVSSAQ